MFPGVSCCVLLLFCCCLWKLVIPHIQTEIFQAPVPPDILTHYREYIFFPMHLGKIKEVQIHVRYSIYLVIDVCALFEYVIHPGMYDTGRMHMCGVIMVPHIFSLLQKVSSGHYQSTREFTHDTEWILHNCIIYNGGILTLKGWGMGRSLI